MKKGGNTQGGVYELNLKHYVDPKIIGLGSSGRVYRAYDPINKMKVAIKRMGLDDGKKEANILKQGRSSKYLPYFHDFFIIDNKAYVVMEYIEGKQIGSGNFTSKTDKRDEKTSVQITINILKAVQQVHKCGFNHNDILPKNIMIKDNLPETVRIFDFHLARELIDRRFLRDLRNTARISVLLMNGLVPKLITGTELKNQSLMAVLMKAIKPTDENRYYSTQEFIDTLLPFS